MVDTVFDPLLLLVRIYSKIYYFVKHHLRLGNVPGFGLLSKLPRHNAVLTVDGAHILFDHRATANYVCLLGGSFNEPETHRFVRRVLDDDRLGPCSFIDVGANIGEMIIDFARHPRISQALAFEPSTLCCSIIERSCALNALRHVTVANMAVGERCGRGVMPRTAHFQCSTAVNDEASTNGENGLEEVQMTTLDHEMSEASGQGIMLIDVEGGELKVMRGGRRYIRRLSPLIIFEYHEITRTHFLLDEVRAELGKDYEILRLRSDGFLDRDLLQTWNCVAVSCKSPFHAIAQSLLVDASRMSAASNETAVGTAQEYR